MERTLPDSSEERRETGKEGRKGIQKDSPRKSKEVEKFAG